jgi:hypothetical protein
MSAMGARLAPTAAKAQLEAAVVVARQKLTATAVQQEAAAGDGSGDPRR